MNCWCHPLYISSKPQRHSVAFHNVPSTWDLIIRIRGTFCKNATCADTYRETKQKNGDIATCHDRILAPILVLGSLLPDHQIMWSVKFNLETIVGSIHSCSHTLSDSYSFGTQQIEIKIKVTGLGTLTPVMNYLKLDIAWRELLTSCYK